ncbi:MAG: hypothetical protein QGG40_12615, partial [Myxococcota bacterium]|nr:hypothetical protein [Myxococcota bacterium]
RVLDEANANYGNNILFWDIVFGTVHWPRDRQADVAVGLHDLPAFPQDYLGQLTSPLRRRSIEQASLGSRSSAGAAS